MTRGAPVELTTFVGRGEELAEGQRLLGEERLVTLVGPGGVGKTRLAARLARQVTRVFRHGVAWVELAPHQDPTSLTTAVAAALGVDDTGQSVDDAVTAYLRTREMLLVLDNCEHLVDACAELAASLLTVAPELRLLATSREPLRLPGEQLIGVGPLQVPTPDESASGTVGDIEAVALLIDRGRAVHGGFQVDATNAELVGRLCRRLDGIPLAIELAAARLRVLSVGQLLDRLDDRFELLTTGPRAVLPRHQTLRGLVDWSYELCPPVEQSLWARMSVFDGGADLEAVEAVCAHPGTSALDGLADLVDKSVVTTTNHGGRVRYRMLETIREYGAEQLACRGEVDRVRARHLAHYLALVRTFGAEWFGPDQLKWVSRIAADLGNVRAALDHSLTGAEDRSDALSLVTAIAAYWPSVGSMDEGSRWFLRALSGPVDAIALTLATLVEAMWHAGMRSDVTSMRNLALRAVELPVVEHTPEVRACRARARAVLASTSDDYPTSLRMHAEALAQYQLLGDPMRQVQHLGTMAQIEGWLGRHDEGLAHAATAMDICDAHGERYERFEIQGVQGNLLWQQGRLDEALVVVRDSLEHAPALRTTGVSHALQLAARIYAAMGDHQAAAVLRGALGQMLEELGHTPLRWFADAHAASEASLREVLGDAGFAAAYEQGRAMSVPDSVALVLGTPSPASHQPARPERVEPPAQSVLSPRERQVAELVASGLSNKDIAQKLVISARTAEGHVARVMDKLGFHSRAEIAAWVTAEGERRRS